jgi:hypothetical protein
MPLVPESRLKGNYGASVLMARLSAECLVRQVAADTDVGIDLYCETVSEGQPFLHFWLQVRAGKQCKIESGGNNATCRFSRDELTYWSRQPVPVFAALVPTVDCRNTAGFVNIISQALEKELCYKLPNSATFCKKPDMASGTFAVFNIGR